jgi:MinD-like ATPase involved in chromosome partitioning or flagellar assembly
MTGSNWQADMLNRLDDGSSASSDATATSAGEPVATPVGQPAPEQLPPPEQGQQYTSSQYPPPQQPVGQYPASSPYGPGPQQPMMAPPPPPPGAGWGAPVPPQEQQPQYDQGQQYQGQQYGQPGPQYPQYQQPPVQQYEQPPYGAMPQVPPTPYEQPYDPQYAQQGPPQYGPGPSYGPPQNYPPPNEYKPPQQYPNQYPQYEPPVYEQPHFQPGPPPEQSWSQAPTGWDSPSPDGGPGAQAYTPAYQDPLAGPLPVASGSVGLQHEEQAASGGFLRRIGRLAAEAAYIAGASGRMQRDVENIAIIRRPIGIGRMIGIIGPVPGSGTSTVAALLADTLASQRTDIVLAVDAFPREGKLTHRLEQGIVATPDSRIQLARAEPTADAISDVLAARNVGGANQIPLSLVDCPAGLFEEATGYVAGAAHAVALIIPSARADALTSINQLDQLTTDGQHMLVDKGLVIIAENQPDDPDAVRWLQSAVSDRGLGYVVLPYDDHLARAWPLRAEELEPATRRAVLELAARLVERATR